MKSTGPVAARSSTASNTEIKPASSTGDLTVPDEFAEALQAFLAGKGDLAAVRREIADSLWVSLEPAAAIESNLKAARKNGMLAPADYRVLIADVQHITTEQTPTDARIAPAMPRRATAAAVEKSTTGKPRKQSSPKREPHVSRPQPESANDGAEPTLGSRLKDRYQLEELVAEGPMGKVFRGSDQLKQQAGVSPAVAIKMLSPDLRTDADALARLRQEAFQVQRLTHPNIINIFDFDQSGTTNFITMEWLSGESLASLLDRLGSHPLERSEVQRIIAAVVNGLAHAHAHGIVHGDIKPANIFLCKDGAIKIMDFGVVRGPAVTDQTDSNAAYAVTPGYASCELLEGKEPGVQDDIYALACTVYRMVAGFRPYGRQTALQAEAGHHVALRPEGLALEQWLVLCRGLSFRRYDRLEDVDQLLEVFAEPSKTESRSGWLKALVVAMLVVLVAGIEVWFGLDEPRSVPGGGDASQTIAVSEPNLAVPEPKNTERPLFSGLPELDRQASEDLLAPPADPENRPRIEAVQPEPTATIGMLPEVSAEAVVASPERDVAADADLQLQSQELSGEDPLDTGNDDEQDRDIGIAAEPTAADVVPSVAAIPPESVVEAPESVVAPESVEMPVSVAAEATAFTRPSGFSRDRYNVNEGDGVLRLSVTAPRGLTSEVSVRLIIESGSAVANNDFAPPAVERLDFVPDMTEKTVFIPLIADAIGENIEEFTVRLESPPGMLSFDNDSALIVIIDDD